MIRRIAVPFLLLTALAAAVPSSATTVNSYLRNREGVREFNKKSYFPAQQKFMKALEDDPMNPQVQLNLARNFEAAEDFEKAESAYRGVLQILPENSTLRFEALFNWAGVLAKLKRIDDALGAYQAALALDPDSIEVKTNIELLWQGGGGGGGEGDPNQDQQKDQKGQGNKREGDPTNKGNEKPKYQGQVSPEDVKRILDEIKNQEQNIRAQEYDKQQGKDMPKAKDW